MITVGLTGGIGMGKSTAAGMLTEWKVPVIDTDVIAHDLVQPGSPALREIVTVFGPDILAPDGTLLRKELARRVFGDAAARQRLESILHPRIREVWQSQISIWKSEQKPLAVVVIPLLFETNAAGLFEVTICVACTADTQQSRLRDRGWSREQMTQRIQAQWPTERKMAAADYVVWSEGVLQVHSDQLRRILQSVTARAKSPAK